MPPTSGSHVLTGTKNLPNATVAFPGEHWSDWTASGAITPGEAIIPAASPDSKGRGRWRLAASGDSARSAEVAIALRPVDVPDTNNGPLALGPNEVRNQVMANGDYVHAYMSGSFQLTLVVPGTYIPGDLIGWDADGVRPADKDGVGAWAKNSAADIDSIFQVQEVREVGDDDEVILTVRSLRGQF